MNLFKRMVIKKNQRGLLLRDGDFVRIVEPGVLRVFDPFNRVSLELYPLNDPLFNSPLADYLRQNESAMLDQHFVRMDLNEDEVGLRYEDNILVEILPPGTRNLYWKGLIEQRLERINLQEGFRLPATLAARLTQQALRNWVVKGLNVVLAVQVPTWHVGLLRVNGELSEPLSPGHYAFWRFNRELSVEVIDTRMQAIEVSGQEILTRDKVALRINLAASWRFIDIQLAFSTLAKPLEHLYRELQFGLRAAVGTRTLDELLENKQIIDEVVGAHVDKKLAGMGMDVSAIGVKDIILPGEMKTILAQVVEAEKAAQANVIRRREETAATRSLLNTAKVMEDNPTALRLKELETLERVAERIDRISVFGGLDQVLNGLVSIKGT